MEFTALQDFYSPETRSDYCAGLGYRAQSDDEVLMKLIPKWIAEGKIQPGRNGATVLGKE